MHASTMRQVRLSMAALIDLTWLCQLHSSCCPQKHISHLQQVQNSFAGVVVNNVLVCPLLFLFCSTRKSPVSPAWWRIRLKIATVTYEAIHANCLHHSLPTTCSTIDVELQGLCTLPPPCYFQRHSITPILVHQLSVFLSHKFGTPYHPLFVTPSHSLLLDVTSLHSFSLLLPTKAIQL